MPDPGRTNEFTSDSPGLAGKEGAASPEQDSRRKVVLAPTVKVIFASKSHPDQAPEENVVPRDLFTVIDAIGSRLAAAGEDTELMDSIAADTLVSVHSVEDPDKSDPLPEGESRWEGAYMLAGIEIESMPIPEAAKTLTKAVLANDMAMAMEERLAEQLFLRSRLSGLVVAASFDGIPAVAPLLSSFRPQTPANLGSLYRSLLSAARGLRAWSSAHLPDAAKAVDWDGLEEDEGFGPKPVPAQKPGLVLPDGSPA